MGNEPDARASGGKIDYDLEKKPKSIESKVLKELNNKSEKID